MGSLTKIEKNDIGTASELSNNKGHYKMKRVHSAGCVVTHEARLESVSELLYRDAKKLKRHTINGEKPGTSERPKKKSSENDTSRDVPLNRKLVTPEGNPDTDTSIDRRGNCCIKGKMVGNGDSPSVKTSKFKEMGGIVEADSVRVDSKIPSNIAPYYNMNLTQPMIPCKGSGRVSKSSDTGTLDLTKRNISGSNGVNFKHNKPLVTHVLTTKRALRFVEDDDGGEDCKTPIHRTKMSNLYKSQSGNLCQTTGTAEFSRSYSMEQKHKPFLEKTKIGPNSNNQAIVGTMSITTSNLSVECYDNKNVLGGQRYIFSELYFVYDNSFIMSIKIIVACRSDITREATSTDSADSKLTESSMSMKHLIAAAQAKRREAHSRQLVDENGTPGSFLTPHCIYGRSPNLISTIQTFPSDDDPFQKDKKCCQTSVPIEPSPVSRQIILMKQGEHGDYDGRPSGGKRQPANSSCDGTEAAIARDALEGMIETLSRTKESIGRATRHSIDCAKYGIATEELLEFLRLVIVKFPLKVLRLWLERRILPEYFLRHYMDEIEFRNGGLRSGCSLRMPACSELSVDNPKRETESLLVDEYGRGLRCVDGVAFAVT
ncbi:ENHANCER OF AG-4 protein 2 [Platanthera guangdongensis]|uniref:ENHANCER OF AG-4 protein 2 n=1 Tax=Platanthera guangdongensis TaxID=2320717 RepID=A0ABR2M0N8_9ASPA